MEYINRMSALEDNQTFSLTFAGIECDGNVIPYPSIEAIELRYAPTRYYSNIYKCKIIHSAGALVLSNRRYIKLGTFEYQSSTYFEFIRKISEELGDEVQIKSGLNPYRYWIELPVSVAFFMAIIAVIFTFGHPLLAFGFLAVLLWRLIPYYRKNYPKTYTNRIIPNQTLPKK